MVKVNNIPELQKSQWWITDPDCLQSPMNGVKAHTPFSDLHPDSTPSPAEAGHLWPSVSASPQELLLLQPRWHDPTYENTSNQSVHPIMSFCSFSTTLLLIRTWQIAALISRQAEQTYIIANWLKTTYFLARSLVKMKHNLTGNILTRQICFKMIEK